jgi:glycosyltransferase involved in cell wall biosynthesis
VSRATVAATADPLPRAERALARPAWDPPVSLLRSFGRGRALVEPGDTRALARAVERVAGIDPGACRRRAEGFDLGAMTDRYEALYRELIASRGAAAPAPR